VDFASEKPSSLMADYLRRNGELSKAQIEFCLADEVLFGVGGLSDA